MPPGEARPHSDRTSDARRRLREKIIAINKQCWLAMWKYDIEFELWEMVLDGSTHAYGIAEVTSEELSSLLALAEEAGGWYVNSCEVPGEEERLTFVPLQEWRERWREIARIVRARRSEQADRE